MTDMETGSKAFRGDIIRNMTLRSRKFGGEVENDGESCQTEMRHLRSAY
jgi:hypothetical protein